MNQTAEAIKRLVDMREAVEHYGFYPNIGGYISCPFHKEKTASLKVYTNQGGHGGWHCFGCGRGGSVIDFVMQLFDINYQQAVIRINQDFNLGLTKEKASRAALSKAARMARQERREEELRESEWWEAVRMMWYFKDVIDIFPPVISGETIWIHPFYAEAVKSLPEVESWMDERLQEGEKRDWKKYQNLPKTTS